MAFAILGK